MNPNSELIETRKLFEAKQAKLDRIFKEAGPDGELDNVTSLSGTSREKAAAAGIQTFLLKPYSLAGLSERIWSTWPIPRDDVKPTKMDSVSHQDRPAERVSLTPDVVNAARNVVFLATGVEKAQALATTLTGAREPLKFPAQRIHPPDGNIHWLVDEAAASLLPEHIEGVTLMILS